MFYVIYETNAHQFGRTISYYTWDQAERVANRLASCGKIIEWYIKTV